MSGVFSYVAVQLPYADLETVADVAEALSLEFCPACSELVQVETRAMDGGGECPICYGRTIEAIGAEMIVGGDE